MTSITTRETAGGGAIVKNAPLTSAEIDNNFISLSTSKLEASQNLGDLTDTDAAKANLDLSGMAAQEPDNVDITGGSISGINDLAIEDGGTGASSAPSARNNLGLGTISTQDASSVNIVGGTISIDSLGVNTPAPSTVGEIRATGDIVAHFSSDRTYKENIQDIGDAINIVSNIGGKTFDWKDDYINKKGGEDEYFVRKNDFGVIAQDVQNVFPLAVKERENGELAVDYIKLCALAFAAIKDLNEKIEKLMNDQQGNS